MTAIQERADRCANLLNDSDLQQAFQDVRDAIHQRFEEIPADDGAGLVQLKQRLHLLDSVRANLERAVTDGKIETANLEDKVEYLGDIWQAKKRQLRKALRNG